MQSRAKGGSEPAAIAEQLVRSLPPALEQVLASRSLDTNRDLGLYFRVATPARQWIGSSLVGSAFRLDNLQDGLHGWRLMYEARGTSAPKRQDELAAAWVRIRQAHVDLWTKAGHNPKLVAVRLDELASRAAKQAAARSASRQITESAHAARSAARRSVRAAAGTIRTTKTEMQIRKAVDVWAKLQQRTIIANRSKSFHCLGGASRPHK